MEHVHYDLGYQPRGAHVRVELDQQARVMLLDQSNYSLYRNGQDARYVGGQQVRSPGMLAIPSAGHWHVAIDLDGGTGNIGSSVVTLPPES